MAPDLDDAKRRIEAEIDGLADRLVAVSHAIHAQPELGFAEQTAHDMLTDLLAERGVEVERSAHGLSTAFVGRAGSSGPTVAVCCEYDALPGIGHACGHNIIAAAGIGAGLAAAAFAGELGGRIRILGTPAEEGGGGKVIMADAGAFADVDAALMVHPADADLRWMNSLAIQRVVVTYTGRAAHAAAAPEKGRNALDAAVLGYVNVAALRQHIRPDERVHGIFIQAGDAANVVPATATAEWYVRSPSSAGLATLRARVVACLTAGADAAGCTLALDWLDPAYTELVGNEPLDDLYAANAARRGRTVHRPGEAGSTVVGSTDMGNISHLVPSIHPMIQVAPPGVAIHTEAFARHAAGPDGDVAVIDGAKAIACTVADLWLRPAALDAARSVFAASVHGSPDDAL